MPRSPLTSRKANVRVPIHQVFDGLRVVVENIPMDQKAKTTSPWRPDLVPREHSRISSIVSLAGWFGLRFKAQRNAIVRTRPKGLSRPQQSLPRYLTRSQLQLLCQLHSEGACFIKARISCEQPTANQ